MHLFKRRIENEGTPNDSQQVGGEYDYYDTPEEEMGEEVNMVEEELSFEKYSIKIFYVMLFLLPVLFIPAVSFPVQFTKTVLVFIGVLVAALFLLISRLRDGQITLPVNKVIFALWALPVVYFLSAIFSSNFRFSISGYSFNVDTFSFVALMALFVTSIVMLMRTKEQILTSYIILFASFVVVWIFQGLRLIFGPEFLSLNIHTLSTSNILGKWNDLAIFFGLATIMSLVTLASLQLSKTYSKILYGMLFISLLFLAIVNLMIVWVIVGIFALGFFVHSIFSGKFDWMMRKVRVPEEVEVSDAESENVSDRKMSIASLIVLVVAVIFMVGGNVINDKITTALGISQIEARPSWQSTLDIAEVTYNDNLLFGSGPNTFVKQWTQYKGTAVNSSVFWNSDFISGIGMIPTAFVSVGLIGGLAWLVFIGLFFFSGFKSLILLPTENRFTYFITLSSFLAGLYLWILNILYTPNVVLVTLSFFFTGIYIASLRHHELNKLAERTFVFAGNPKTGFISVFALTFLMLVVIVGIYSIGKSYAASINFQSGVIVLNAEGDLDVAEDKITRASQLATNDRHHRLLADIYIRRLTLLQQETGLSEEEIGTRFRQYLAVAIENGQRATEIDETNYQNWVALGRVYHSVVHLGIQGAYENAVESYNRALIYNPDSPLIYLTLARLDIANGDTDAARVHIQTALEKRVITPRQYF